MEVADGLFHVRNACSHLLTSKTPDMVANSSLYDAFLNLSCMCIELNCSMLTLLVCCCCLCYQGAYIACAMIMIAQSQGHNKKVLLPVELVELDVFLYC